MREKSSDVRRDLYENLIARTIIDHSKTDHSLHYDELLYNLEKDYHLENIPQLHVSNAMENMIEKKILSKNNQILTISREYEEETNQNIEEMDKLRTSILEELKNKIQDKIPDLDSNKLNLLLENFENLLSSTFARYGITLAQMIMDSSKNVKSIKGLKGFSDGYVDSIQQLVSENKRELLDKIFNQYFFKPSDNLSKYLYALAQSYILIEILNVDPELKRIEELAWQKKKIYLDTNVLLPVLFEGHPEHESILSIVKNTVELGAQVVVSETTSREFEKLIDSFKKNYTITSIDKRLTFLKETEHDDSILETYLIERNRISGFTIDSFCVKFENYPLLLEKLKVKVEDDYTQSLEDHNDLEKLTKKIKQYSARKNERTAFHDAYHILKVREIRKNMKGNEIGPDCWFLTVDHSLPMVERDIYGGTNVFASIMAEIWVNLISNFLSPKMTIDFGSKAFTQLLSSKFSSHKVKHDDLVNIMTVFMNDDQFTNDELRIIIGDKFAKDTLRKIKDVLDKGEELTLDQVKPFVERMKELLTQENEQKRKEDRDDYSRKAGILESKLNHLTEELGIIKEESRKAKTNYSRLKKTLIIILVSAAINAIVSLVLSGFIGTEQILWTLLGLLGSEAIVVFFFLLKHHIGQKEKAPWSRGEKLALIGIFIGILSIVLTFIGLYTTQINQVIK